jgi:hypothetical protein
MMMGKAQEVQKRRRKSRMRICKEGQRETCRETERGRKKM